METHSQQTEATVDPKSTRHWKDWPNAAAFNYETDHRVPRKIDVQGCFPDYVAGTLFRTGPNAYRLGREREKDAGVVVSHWFDGFTTVHKFDIIGNEGYGCQEIWYSSYCQVDEKIARARQTGKLDEISFGQRRDPCETLYSKFKTMFAAKSKDNPHSSNIGVALRDTLPVEAAATVDQKSRRLMTVVTDTNAAKTFDRDTLEPVGVTRQDSLHKALSGPLSAAHAAHDPDTHEYFNYNLAFGPTPTYRVFRTALTGKTDILAEIHGPDVHGAYLHSLLLTKNFVVLCIWPSFFRFMGLSILYERNLLDAMAYYPGSDTLWIVVDRHHGRGVVKKFRSPAFFCFHTVNAWEEEHKDSSTVDITCELVEFKNMDILYRFYYENLVSDQPGVKERDPEVETPRLSRYHLANIPKETRSSGSQIEQATKIMSILSGDLPRINPRYVLKQHRYIYTVLDRGNSSFLDGIGKTDVKTGETLVWEVPRHTPGEPVFVPSPGDNRDEDDGAVLSVILDGDSGSSYLLCLDAKTMKEMGRASVGVPVGLGFHGTHVSR